MADVVKIFDTTLRDGEQSPGCSMNLNEKLKIARQLALLKVDVIEAGFAISSPGDAAAVEAIAREVKNCSIASLARLVKEDIDAAAAALKPAVCPTIHVFIATSPLHMEYKLKMRPEEVLSQIKELVPYARSLCPQVEFSCEDATRSDRDFLSQCVDAAIAGGATTINIPDTVGYATPEEMSSLIHYLQNNVPNIDQVTLSVHCHNDLGLAVANSLASVKAGARQVECAINGIGERAGNAALEEVVMAIETRKAYYGCGTNIETRQLYRSSSKLSRIIGVSIPPNKAVVGANAFAHEAGIHQHGVLANRETYEIMTPESVGVVKNNLILGKHSGRHAFEDRLISLGYNLKKETIDELFITFKKLSDRKKDITDYDLEALVETRSQTKKYYELDRFIITSGNTIRPTAIVRLKHQGREIEDVALGDGPIFASYKAIDKLTGMDLHLEDYSIRSVSQGEDALGQVSVKVSLHGRTVTGRGLSTDILEYSILAYLHAINKLLSLEEQPV